MGDFIFRHARACCTKYACTTPHCLYGKEKVCFLVASKPISLYAFLIHEVCMFKTDRYMLNALFLGSWSLAPWLHGPCDSWSLALGPCLLLLGSWPLALHASLHLQGSQFVLYMALGPWLLVNGFCMFLNSWSLTACRHVGPWFLALYRIWGWK